MFNTDTLLIMGAGGHGKVVRSTAEALGWKKINYLVDDPSLLNKSINGCKVVGDRNVLQDNKHPAVLGIGSNQVRKQIATQFSFFDKWQTFIHPRAYVHPSAKIGLGTVIFAGAVIQPDAVIGNHCIINTGATVDHDCILEDYVHIAPGVHLAGEVTVGEGSFFGIGSVAIPYLKVGRWTQIGAGAVVVRDIDQHQKVMGVPARVVEEKALV